jgi:hypothetical protein
VCVITRKSDNTVVGIYHIPGSDENLFKKYNIYFPVVGALPSIGEIFIPDLVDGLYRAPQTVK